MNWTPPEDAEVVKSNWTPPEDAVPIDSKKKESSVESPTGSADISQSSSPSQSQEEIPTVQITDGEIDASPLNRPSTMPFGVKMDDEGKIMADTDQDRKKRLSDQNRVKRIDFLKQKTAQNFKDNPELYSDPKNRDNYYNTLLKYYKPEDVAEIIGNDRWQDEGAGLITTTYRPNPITGESDLFKEDSHNTIKQPFQTIGEATGEGIKGGVEKISKASQQLSPNPQDQLKAGLGLAAGALQTAMGAANIVIPEFALFTLGTKQAEESLPVINKVMAPVASALEHYYKDKKESPPAWMEDTAALADFAWNILLFKGAMKAGKKLSFSEVNDAIKSMTPSDIEAVSTKISEKYNTPQESAPVESKSDNPSAIEKFSDDSGELFKQNDVAMEEANNLSSQAETLTADLEKAKGTPAEPIIAKSIEDINTKIDEIHNTEADKQSAEAHILATLDHLQQQKSQLESTKESLSPEGKAALDPEIKKVDDMIKEISPKEEAKEVVPDNEVKELPEHTPAEDVPDFTEAEIQDAYETRDKEIKGGQLSYKEQFIHDNFPRMTKEDFMHYGDRNWIVKGEAKKGGTLRRMALQYFSKKALPLDVQAQQMSEAAGIELTPQDFVDYVMRRELEPEAFKKKTQPQILNDAAEIPVDAAKEIEAFAKLGQDYTTVESVEAARGFPLSDAEADLIIDYLKNKGNEKTAKAGATESVQAPNEPIAESKGVEAIAEPAEAGGTGDFTKINDELGGTKDYGEIKESISDSNSNKFRELQETTSESVRQKRLNNLTPEELHIEKNYGEIVKQLKESGLLKGPCI